MRSSISALHAERANARLIKNTRAACESGGQSEMATTRSTLLARIKNPRNTEAWAQFYELYAPLIYRYARARRLGREDAEDVRSKCYEAIVQQIKTFDYDRAKGGFKAWLRTLVNRRVVDLLRKKRERHAESEELRLLVAEEPTPDEIWERQWKHQHLKYCVEQIRTSMSQHYFEAFSKLVLEGWTVSEVCDHLGLSPNQVYKAKSRLLRRVRRKLAEIGYEEEA